MLKHMKEIKKIIDEEVSTYIWRNLAKGRKFHMCLFCKNMFAFKTKYHHFCSRKCYSKFHRLPGFVRRLINQTKD